MESPIQQPEFQVPDRKAENLWQSSQSFSSAWSRWNAYLNVLSLSAVIPWLKAEYGVNSVTIFQDWEHITGSAIKVVNSSGTLQQKWLILIPSAAIDQAELRVPERWVKTPNQVGNYYLAASVNPDELSVCLWAYTTRSELEKKSVFEECDRAYSMAAEDLFQDFHVLWVAEQLRLQERSRLTEL